MIILLKDKQYVLELMDRTLVMGILNVTPDSFSDGGKYIEKDRAIEHGLAMVRNGADIIDIGGESTRPYSKRISTDEEMDRVIPVIEGLSRQINIPISIDTCKSAVAQEAVMAGASIINDISALRFDPRMGQVAASLQVPVILMHMQGTPETMQDNPHYDNLLTDIKSFFIKTIEYAKSLGIKEENIIIDPGIGFGKTMSHNLTIIRNLSCFQSLNRPILLGTSNKAFIGRVVGNNNREMGTMATIACGIMSGASIVRVHNVKMAVPVVKMADAIKNASNT